MQFNHLITILVFGSVPSLLTSGLASQAIAQTEMNSEMNPEMVEVVPTVQDAFNEAYFKHAKPATENNTIVDQANTIFGFFDGPEGSFPENQIRRDGKAVHQLYEDMLRQQTAEDPIMRSQDLANPYCASISTDPSQMCMR